MVKVPNIVRKLFPSVFWKGSKDSKVVYLTFDDGPTPEVTVKVLALLKQYNAFATFFCLGNKVELYPTVFQQVLEQGHSVGNHTHDHFLGLRTSNKNYFTDVEKANKVIQSYLFRPPYGKMKLSQYRFLNKKYKVVLWDVIPGDYKKSITVAKLISNVVDNVSNGSVVVLHDNEKCAAVMLTALPVILNNLTSQGYQFKAIVNEK